ncbi:hypothetical protein F5883DRAFT_718896 [Diaporthe sp. PMI_573]|nr:hypothetical protein F5883DRAFT_718896 [Diaporthaceae sp. PMI_573]
MKGQGMWDNIMKDFLRPEEANTLSKDKKMQKAALLKAYAKWEENCYKEVFKLFIEELHNRGHVPAYKWKSVHIEAELVRLGLEQKQREPSRGRRRRVHIPVRHRSGMYTKSSSVRNPISHFKQQQPLDVFNLTTAVNSRHKGILAGFPSHDIFFDQLNEDSQPILTDEQHEQLIDECLKRTPFDTGLGDPALAAVEHRNSHRCYQHGSTKILDDHNTKKSSPVAPTHRQGSEPLHPLHFWTK